MTLAHTGGWTLGRSEQPNHLSRRESTYPFRSRIFRQPRHGHDLARARDHESRAGCRPHVIDSDVKSRWTSEDLRIIRERVLRLRNADRSLPEPDRLEIVDRTRRFGRVLDAVATVHLPHDRFDFLLDVQLRRIEWPILRALFVQQREQLTCEFLATRA